jgi:TonB family protein
MRVLRVLSMIVVLAGCQLTSDTVTTRQQHQAPQVLVRVEPEYPASFRRDGIEGSVQITGLVPKEGGQLRDARVVRSDDDRLNQLALDAVQKWVWKAGLQNGIPVDVEFTTTVRFSR